MQVPYSKQLKLDNIDVLKFAREESKTYSEI
jgi:hypothetical protein